MARKPTGILETDFYDFLETAWSLSDRQLSRAISFLTDIQQRRATYGTCQAMADQKNEREEMPLRAFADQIREDKGRKETSGMRKSCRRLFIMEERRA